MKILLAGYPQGYMRVLGSKLAEAGFETTEAYSLAEAQSHIGNLKPDTVICCFPWLKGVGYMTVVSAFKEAWRGADLIIIDRHIELHVAVDLIHAGVFSCLNYPFATEQLLSALNKLKERRASARGQPVWSSDIDFVKGISSVAKNMYHLIDLVAPTNFNVLIYGETGTGKELVARHIAHKGSSDAPFIAVDCGCLSRELALSELFGHEKGSFTGALEKKTGAFETANKGTLFLDEIGNLDYEVQGFLLRAVQERKIRRVGSVTDLPVQTRIVAASNRDLGELVEKGQFREDLYHRLNEFEIIVPPLRQRAEDLYIFISHFLSEINHELKKNVLMPAGAALLSLLRYPWPGNLRELKNVVRRACLLCATGTAIQGELLPGYIKDMRPAVMAESREFQETDKKTTRSITLKDVEEALIRTNYNKSETARLLGIDRKTLYNRLRNVISQGGLKIKN